MNIIYYVQENTTCNKIPSKIFGKKNTVTYQWNENIYNFAMFSSGEHTF